jgi:hypothetical protein
MAKRKDRDTYTLTVTFSRSFSADMDVVNAGDQSLPAPTDAELIQQLRKELQFSYDDGDIAGSFDITAINTKNCRAPTYHL